MAESGVMIVVEIVFAEADRAVLKSLSLPHNATVEEALLLAEEHDELRLVELQEVPLGIYGQVVQRDRVLENGDRIEIYRPLSEDPKVARRKRAGRPRSR